MLIKHRLSHLTQGSIFPFHNTILGKCIRTQKLVFKTQVMAKGFEARASEFRAIVTANCPYGISVPLIPQPQDKISNKTKRLPFSSRKSTHAYREYSSTTTRTYHFPPADRIRAGPTRSIWSSSHERSVITSVRGE
jgi:hypothetical protein